MNTNTSQVLLVDNEPKILELVQRILKNLPIEITTAKTGEEGLNILQGSKVFSLTISNFYLGMGMNGGDFLKLVKEHSPKTIRILMTAGINQDSLLERQEKGEYDWFATKPIIFQNFIDQVERSIYEYWEK